jgi:hypothetical protein
MPSVIVILTRESQAELAQGKTPETIEMVSYDTQEEIEAFVNGMEAVDGLSEYEVPAEGETWIDLDTDGGTTRIDFLSPAEKSAYMYGLEKADGFDSPAIYSADDDGYPRLVEIVAAREAAPAPTI